MITSLRTLSRIEVWPIDAVQVIYNIFEQAPESELFRCVRRSIGVIARVPFDEGGLTGAIRPDTVFPDGTRVVFSR